MKKMIENYNYNSSLVGMLITIGDSTDLALSYHGGNDTKMTKYYKVKNK